MSRKARQQEAASFNREAIPAFVRELHQWVCWKQVKRNGKWTKVPIDPKTGLPASSTDRATWGTFEEALRCWRCSPQISGIGIVLTTDDPLTGIDLDDCMDEIGVLSPEAREIIRSFDSYTESTPSGRGVRILIRGKKPPSHCKTCRSKNAPGIEVYDDCRFLTITAERMNDTRATIESRPAQLDALLDRIRPRRRHNVAPSDTRGEALSDEDLLNRMWAASNGDAIRRLWDGDTSAHGDDDSSADMALCAHLAFWTGRDAVRIDRLFRRSGLMRPKWDESRGDTTYGRMTTTNAIALGSETYDPHRKSSRIASTPDGVISKALPAGALVRPGGIVVLPGDVDPVTGRMLVSIKAGLATVKAFIDAQYHHADGPTLIVIDGEFHWWNGRGYVPVPDDRILQALQRWLAEAICVRSGRNSSEVRQMDSNSTVARDLLNTMRAELYVSSDAPFPRWRSAADGDCSPADLIVCGNAYIHALSDRIIAPTPRLLSTASINVDYDARAPQPQAWLRFVHELFADDTESRDLLQMWFGYCLLGDSRHQKMLLLVGPRRSGKGTIARVLKAILGERLVASPTTSSLCGQFGLQGLLGRKVAIIEDARFGGQRQKHLVELLLTISGGGGIEVDRKHHPPIAVELGTKFMFLSNQIPSLPDPTGALASRFLVLELTKNYLDHEDTSLGDRLVAEAPGILLWSIEGQRMLSGTGRFNQPSRSLAQAQALLDLSAPHQSFVTECCVRGPGRRVIISTLYGAWCEWARARDIEPGTPQKFGNDLKDAGLSFAVRETTHDARFYSGIALQSEVGG